MLNKIFYFLRKLIEKILKETNSILNFNFTSTPFKVNRIPKEKIYYIHGSLVENYIIGNANDNSNEGFRTNNKTLNKNYLRDILDFKRYTIKNHIFNKHRFENFKIYDKYYYTWNRISPYLIDTEIFTYLYQINESLDEFSKYFSTNTYRNWILITKRETRKIKEKLLKRRENIDFFDGILEYISSNNYRPFKIQLPINKTQFIDFNDVTKITIIGHSLNSDEDLIADLLKACQNLKEISIFVYNGEEVKNLKRLLSNDFLHNDIKITKLNYDNELLN